MRGGCVYARTLETQLRADIGNTEAQSPRSPQPEV